MFPEAESCCLVFSRSRNVRISALEQEHYTLQCCFDPLISVCIPRVQSLHISTLWWSSCGWGRQKYLAVLSVGMTGKNR